MTANDSKEEISDTDSGIILHSGLESPTSPLKDLSTNSRALKLKHQSLEERLEACLLELRKICIREAELTGNLPADFPLMLDENPPRVRRRIGASFKLDEDLIHLGQQESAVQGLERDLAVQQQIYEATRKLCQEENLSKSQRRSRLQQFMKEEKKVQELQDALLQLQSHHPSQSLGTSKDLNTSDDSSLSDVVALDDDVDLDRPPSSPVTDGLQKSVRAVLKYEGSPLQNSPWKESSLDMPYQKSTKPQSAGSSRSSSPISTKTSAETSRFPLSQFIRNAALRHSHSTSTPSTPELRVRRQYAQSFRLHKGRSAADSGNTPGTTRLSQQRCAADFILHSLVSSPLGPPQSTSGGRCSKQSFSSCTSLLGRDGPTEIPKLCPPPYRLHFPAQKKNLLLNNFQSPGILQKSVEEHNPLLIQNIGTGSASSPPVVQRPQQRRKEGASSPRRPMKLPPPYTRLVRTPSLNEYPNHAVRLMPREIVTEELKSWHQRNQLQKSGPGFWPQQSVPSMEAATSPQPPFQQSSGTVVLQRSADGTPLQWFVAADAEIVSQV